MEHLEKEEKNSKSLIGKTSL